LTECRDEFPDLKRLFNPRNVLLVGASARQGSIGRVAVDNLLNSSIQGERYFVGPGAGQLGMANCYDAISDLPPVDIDVAMIVVPAGSVEAIISECARRQAKFAIVISSGFGELGDEGLAAQKGLAETARRHGMRIYGPNCPGLTNGNRRIGLNISSSYLRDLVSGPIGLVTQGGGLGRAVLQMSKQATGVGLWASAGNECDLDLADLVAHVADQPEIGALAIIAEGFRSGPRFVAAAERARSEGKPVVILKIGQSEYGSKAAASHTAAMVGSDDINSTVFKKHGVIRVADVDELYETAALAHRATGKRLGNIVVFGFSGGANGFASDVLGAEGLRLAEFGPGTVRDLGRLLPKYAVVGNPIDLTTRIFTEQDLHRRCLEAITRAAETETILIPIPGDYGTLTEQLADDVIAIGRQTDKLIVPVWMSTDVGEGFATLARGGMLPFRSVGKAVVALRRLADYRRSTELLRQPKLRPLLQLEAGGNLQSFSEAEGKRLLALAGIGTPRERLVRSAQEASDFARTLGGQVAVKIVSPDIPHKTEAGGVVLDVDPADVAGTFEEVIRSSRSFDPAARIEGALVSAMEREGRDFLVAVHTDPIFGPVLTIGLGGTEVELINDKLHFHLPLHAGEIAAALQGTRLAAIVSGVRGRPALDADALVATAERLAGLGARLSGTIRELEINPLRVLPKGKGAVALDVLVVPRDSERP